MDRVIVPLGQYTKIKTGKLDANASSIDGKYPFFTCSKEPLRISNYSYDCECVLVAGNGDLNVKYYSGKFDAYQRTYIIESKNDRVLDTRYLFYFLDKYVDKLREQSIGGVIKYIKLGYLTEASLPLPSLPEQQQIADVLDRTSILIEKRKAQIEKLDLLVKSQFIEMFGDPVTNPKGWAKKQISDIADVGSSKRVFVEELVDDGIPFYRGTEIGALAAGEKISPTLFISPDHYEKLKAATGVPKIGDLLMPSICPDGRIWRVDTERPFYFKDGRVLCVHFTEKDYNDTYLLYAIKEKIISDYLNIASGTTFAELKIFSLKSVQILLPPLSLQNQFASFVQTVEAQKSRLQASLAKLEQNYKSLMQKCFRGEIF